MNATLRHLLKETLLRWRMRPSSPLARIVLTFILTATAGGFLAGFAASASALRAQLARLGFNTLVIRSVGRTAPPSPLPPLPDAHWAAPLASLGELTVLQQAPLTALTPWDQAVTVFLAPWPVLARLHAPAAAGKNAPPAAIWLTQSWPRGRPATFTLTGGGGSVPSLALPPEGPWRALLDGDALLVPADAVPTLDPRSLLDTVLFTPDSAGSLESWAASIQRLFAASPGPAPIIQDPGPLRAALATLEYGQALWRIAILALLGSGIVLMFAAIGILEHREMRFAQALLRSLGIRARLLWSASLAENLLLANLALIAALLSVQIAASAILAHLPGLEEIAAVRLPLSACLYLAAVVNAGVLASLAPLARSLRQPIGTMLA